MAIKYTSAAASLYTLWGATQGSVAGIVLDSRSQSFSNPKELLMNSQNTPIGFANDIDKRHEVSLSGEINNNTGIMAAAFATAITYANTTQIVPVADATLFGFDAFGDWYLEDPLIDESRSSWKKFSCKFVRFANGTGVAITGNAA